MKNILLVENDLSLAQTIKSHLKHKNYNCIAVPSLEQGYTWIDRKTFDLCILDRVLDDGDGLEIAQYLDDTFYRTKILILSQKSALKERILGLEEGADDYLAKPFNIAELSLKVEKLLAKQKVKDSRSNHYKNLTLFPETGEIVIDGVRRIMRKKEILILDCLLRYRNQVVNRKLLVTEVWAGECSIPTYTTLDVYIRRLRIFLGKNNDIIKTVRGFGYLISD